MGHVGWRGIRRVRFAAALAVGLLAFTVGTGTAAGAADAASVDTDAASGRELAVSGSFTATGNFESTPTCPSFHTWHNGGGDWTGLGAVTFNLDYCVELNLTGPSPLSGSFTITAADGTLTGSVEGQLGAVREPEGFPVDYTLTVTGGTGSFTRATGTLVFTAFWDHPDIPVFSMHGTVSGTVVLPLPTPSSIHDCLQGGWRNFGDDAGRPFEGQVDCIRFVLGHPPH